MIALCMLGTKCRAIMIMPNSYAKLSRILAEGEGTEQAAAP
jgi:hypothetical protein